VTFPKPRWTSSSFLVYAGGLVVLASAVGSLSYLSSGYGDGAYVAWALLILGVLETIAHGLRLRGRWTSAGIFAFAGVIAFGALVGALWRWFGWLSDEESAFGGFDVARLSLVLLTLIVARVHLRRFRFPLIALITTVLGWFFVTDLVSGGGSWSAVVTLLVGLLYLGIGSASDRPTAFWLHSVAGLLIGGSLLYWWHTDDWQWALIAVAALGLLAPATHFTLGWIGGEFSFFDDDTSAPRIWVPLVVYAVTGFILVALGLLAARRRGALAAE
jgi:hypothetical protein